MAITANELATNIANLSINHYNNLPKTGKPNKKEWTILATILEENQKNLRVVSLATGSKCIGGSKLCPNGRILNDSHAEVLCRRSFLKYLYEQIELALNTNTSEIFYIDNLSKKCILKENINFHFFTTQIFCGDAAIIPKESNENAGEAVASDIYRTGAKCLKTESKQDVHDIGDKFHIVGAIRTKPGRGDPTLSVSCSDKVAKWIRIGIQGAFLTLLIDKPIYLSSIVFPKNIPFSMDAINRALVGRFCNSELLVKPYLLQIPSIFQVDVSFFDKSDKLELCPSSIIWTRGLDRNLEVSVDGRRQGVTKKALHTDKAVVSICKRQIAKRFLKIITKHSNITEIPENVTYRQLKDMCHDYNRNWEILKKDIFKNWTTKPSNLLNFVVNETIIKLE